MTGLPDNSGNDFIRGLETRACVNGMTKSDVERLKNALVKKILDDKTVIEITDDGGIVADSDGLFISIDGQKLGLSVDGEEIIPVTEPYLPEDSNENPLAPPNNTIMTSANIAVDPRIVHTTGNELVSGIKQGNWQGYRLTNPNPTTVGKWLRYAIFNIGYASTIIEMYGTRANNGIAYGIALIGGGGGPFQRSASAVNCYPITYSNPVVAVLNSTTGKNEIWIYTSNVNEVKEINFYLRFVNYLDRFTFPQTEHDTISNADGDTYGTQVVILGQVNP